MIAAVPSLPRPWGRCLVALGGLLALAAVTAAPVSAQTTIPSTTTSTSTSTTLPGTPTTTTTTALAVPVASTTTVPGSTATSTTTVPPTTTTTFVPNPARKWKGSTVELRGHGWGHGRGLGQYGSLGYATDEDVDYSFILDHYYGGTTKGSQPDGPITVRLTDLDNKSLVVTSGAPFQVSTSSFPAGAFARVRRTGGQWAIEQGTSCSSATWAPIATATGDQQPTASVLTDPGDDITKMLTVCGTNRRTYRGTVKAIFNGTIQQAVNTVAMEQYLRGVVPRESPASWGDVDAGKGINALKAQAVAARSYAWAEQRSTLFKTCDTTACQVYGGAGLNGQRIEDARSDRAVAETAGEVRVADDGSTARTEFSSSTGGYTAGGKFIAVPDAGDATATNPNHNWSATVGVGAVEAAFPTTGYLASIVVTDRNGLGDDGGRVLDVRITGSGGSVTVTGDAFRSALKLKSDWYRVIDPGLNAAGVAAAPGHVSNGLLVTSVSGEALAYGGVGDYGSMEGVKLNKPIVGVATTPSDKGYFMVASDGGIFAFGDAVFRGSTGGVKLNKPIVGMASTPSGNGYWLVATDGGIFSFGDAGFFGSTGAVKLNKPIVGMAPTPTGGGYYLVASDGGIFTFGDATFRGSTGAVKLAKPIVGMTADPAGRGYWFVAADGGVFSYPNTLFQGSAGGTKLPAPIVGMATTPTGNGYWLVGQGGALYDYGDATF